MLDENQVNTEVPQLIKIEPKSPQTIQMLDILKEYTIYQQLSGDSIRFLRDNPDAAFGILDFVDELDIQGLGIWMRGILCLSYFEHCGDVETCLAMLSDSVRHGLEFLVARLLPLAVYMFDPVEPVYGLFKKSNPCLYGTLETLACKNFYTKLYTRELLFVTDSE